MFSLGQLSFCLVFFLCPFARASDLGQYNVDRSQISVSGISSGAVMATQFHVIHSSNIMGAGIVAGIPFHASGGSLSGALSSMSYPSYSVTNLKSTTTSMASNGAIDSPSNMQNDKVYIFAGTRDTVVSPQNGPKIQQYYQEYTSNIKTKFDLAAEHCMPTENYGVPCSQLSHTDYMNKCQYNAAYELLNYIYGGNLTKPSASTTASGKVMTFDQTQFFNSTGSGSSILNSGNNNLLGSLTGSNPLTNMLSGMSSASSSLMNSYTSLLESYTKMLNGMVSSSSQLMKPLLGKRKRLLMLDFLNGLSKLPGMSQLPGLSGSSGAGLSGLTGLGGLSSSMDNTGYIYVPSGCLDKQIKCKLHIAFHGCKMGRQAIQDKYVLHAGYNEVAELNNIIILYPQAVTSMMNPNGCWDWWGYTDVHFESKDGVQVRAVKAMMDRLTGISI